LVGCAKFGSREQSLSGIQAKNPIALSQQPQRRNKGEIAFLPATLEIVMSYTFEISAISEHTNVCRFVSINPADYQLSIR